MHNMSDELLIEKVKNGDKYSFNLLVWKWEKPMYNLARRMLGSEEDASDTCQDIFITAYEKIDTFKGNSKFSTWLYRIAVNKCISKLRRRKVEKKHIDDRIFDSDISNDFGTAPLNESDLIKKQATEKISKSLQSLPEEQRTVLELKIYQDLSFEEISNIIGVPVGTAKSRMHYALKKIREDLKGMNLGPF